MNEQRKFTYLVIVGGLKLLRPRLLKFNRKGQPPRVAIVIDTLMFRHCNYLASTKSDEAQKQTPIAHVFKK